MWRWCILACLTATGLAGEAPQGDPGVYWVTFIDKGPAGSARHIVLSDRCLARRAKVRGEDLTDQADWPVHEPYIDAVRPHVRRIRHRSRWLNAISVEATAAQAESLSRATCVRSVRRAARSVRAPDPVRRDGSPDYGAAEAQVKQLRVDHLHMLGYSGKGVFVCLLDTGFYKDHESLTDLSVVAERDFVFGDDDTQRDPANPQDYSDSHGTSVWSALGGNSPGHVIGPAYGASFLLAKTEDLRWELPVEEDHWVAAIEWADSAGADVVSSSLAYTTFDDGSGYSFGDLDGSTAVTTIAADRAAALGIAVVVAAGNFRGTSWGHIATPADGDSVIAAGAVDERGVIAGFSSPGPTADGRIKPEVCARGVATTCALNTGISSYGWASGTSLSTPLVAGVAALLLEINPAWTGADVRSVLMATSDRSHDPDNDYGWGIVDALAASGLHLPIIIAAGADVDDDLSGDSMGNGNGFLELGERVELSVTLVNDGSGPSASLTCALSSPDEAVTVVRDTVTVPSLSPGDTTRASPFVMDYASWGLADTEASFDLAVMSGPDTLTTWEFTIPVYRLYALAGQVVEAGAGSPVSASVRIIPDYGSVPDTVSAEDGVFSLWLPAGDYALQARAAGFISPDAEMIGVPGDSAVMLPLFRPRLLASPDTLRQVGADTCVVAPVTVVNGGTGALRFTAMVASSGEPTRPREELVELRTDPREGGVLDLVTLSGSVTEQGLLIRLDAAGSISPSLGAVFIGLDTDGDPTNGLPACGLQADYRVEWAETSMLSKAAGSRWMPVGSILSTQVDSTLYLTVPTTLIAPCVSPLRMAASTERTTSTSWVLDRLPDDGGTDPVVWYLAAPSWIETATAGQEVAPGAAVDLDMSIDTRGLAPGTYRADVVFQGGFAQVDPVSIVLTVTSGDSGPADRPVTLQVGEPVPNPVPGDEFSIRIGLPASCPVNVELLDMAGRRLLKQPADDLPEGWSDLVITFPAEYPRGASRLRVKTPHGEASRIVIRH